MKPFQFKTTVDSDEAVRFGKDPNTLYIAGGTTAVDLMKYHVWQPNTVVDVRNLELDTIESNGDTLSIGSGATMTDTAYHGNVGENFPMIRESLLLAASQGIRNSATIGGNIMQRSRCAYFRNVSYKCNRREPKSGCDAIGGWNRYHAILGTSKQCIATHASDLCVALVALEASVTVLGEDGERKIAFADFHRLPQNSPERTHDLNEGELILRIEVPQSLAATNSTYVKVRDRNSYAFALCSVAAGMAVSGGAISEIKIGLGGVATVPWKATRAEKFLMGKAPTEENFKAAAKLSVRDAKSSPSNEYKIPLIQNTLVDALMKLKNRA